MDQKNEENVDDDVVVEGKMTNVVVVDDNNNDEEASSLVVPDNDNTEEPTDTLTTTTTTTTSDETKKMTTATPESELDQNNSNVVDDDDKDHKKEEDDKEEEEAPEEVAAVSNNEEEEVSSARTDANMIKSDSVGLRQRRQTLLAHPELVNLDYEDHDEEQPKTKRTSMFPNHQQHPQNQPQPQRRHVAVLSDHLQLAISQQHVNRAVMAVLFAVFTDAMNLQCTAPNYPLMVRSGDHPDSFPNTNPLGFTSAQYMISGAANGAAFLSNLAAGYLSDKLGRRKVLLTNLGGSVLFTIVKYFARNSFWTFTAMTFVNGLFGSTASVALGYMTEVFLKDRKKADAHLSFVIAILVVGRSLGGLMTVLFPQGLFLPLLPTAFITFCGLLVCYKYVLEPSGMREALGWDEKDNTIKNTTEHGEDDDDDDDKKKNKKKDDESKDLPDQLDIKALANVILGAVADNAGSLGLIPLALSPLMIDTYRNNLIDQGLAPVMREQTYRWLYSMIAVIAVPGAMASAWCFQKAGVAMSCVLANIFTGAVIVSLLYVAEMEPTTTGSFALYASIMYVGFPFTVISQLSTGPMLDRLTPLEQKGFIQGINGAISDGSAAVFPFLYAILADAQGNKVAMWVAIGASLLAAVINTPLIFHPKLKVLKKAEDEDMAGDDMTVATVDEEALQGKLERGDFVAARDLWTVNMKRLEKGEPFLYTHAGKYSRSNAISLPKEEYMYLRDLAQQRLRIVHEKPEVRQQIVDALNVLHMDKERAAMTNEEMGVWFSDYLVDNGYFAGEHAPILKSMFKSSFPRLSSKDVTVDNIEPRLVRIAKLMNDYMHREGLDDEYEPWIGGQNDINAFHAST